nr:sulfite exporter TauE/SafE family protein [Campylobacter lanienae]
MILSGDTIYLLIALFVAIGVGVGFISGFFGIGGGTILVPILLNLGFDIKSAIGISVLQMFMGAVFGSYINYKNKKLVLNDGIVVGIGGLLGASFSGFIVLNMPGIVLKLAVLFILFVAIIKFFQADVVNENPKDISKFIMFGVGVLVGAVAISAGIGGALFLTPIFVGFLKMDIKKAISIGLFFVIFSSFSGLISLANAGLVDYKSGFTIGIGSIIGVYFGVKFGHKVDKNIQKRLALGLYIIMFILMVKNILF